MAAPVNWRMGWSMIDQFPKQGGGQLPPFRGALTACHPQPTTFPAAGIQRSSANRPIRRCECPHATIARSHYLRGNFGMMVSYQRSSAAPPNHSTTRSRSRIGRAGAGLLGCKIERN
jgi:hypothetical protein